jgi:ribosomal protein L11 methyltransferase
VKDLPERNWNREWERNFNPIIVDEYCRIRASFHKIKDALPIEIVIDPKMSFGTGHHDTTYLMIQQQLELNHQHKNVLDAGCGTGILSILAEKLGASEVMGFDIDQWAYENSKDNLQLNACKRTKILYGDLKNIPPGSMFDIILANINLNVIISEMKGYFNHLSRDGFMILSGFYSKDYEIVNKKAEDIGLKLHKKTIRNNWLSLVYYKKPE